MNQAICEFTSATNSALSFYLATVSRLHFQDTQNCSRFVTVEVHNHFVKVYWEWMFTLACNVSQLHLCVQDFVATLKELHLTYGKTGLYNFVYRYWSSAFL